MTTKCMVDGEWTGWDGQTIVRLTNGQIWEQTQYYYEYRYAYRPEAVLITNGYSGEMVVKGMRKPVKVRRLR
jgi:hypothetical protein